MAKHFQCDIPGNIQVLFAYYGYAEYSGRAFVLFRKGKKLFEVHGGHCSCNGLEGQWKPEQTAARCLKVMYDERWGKLSWAKDDPAAQEGLFRVLASLTDE